MFQKRFSIQFFALILTTCAFLVLSCNLNTNATNNSGVATTAAGALLLGSLSNQSPSSPKDLVGVANSEKTEITLSWVESTDSDGTVSDYEVKIGSKDWISSGIDLTHSFKDLKIGVYKLYCRAKDDKLAYSKASEITFKLGNRKPTVPRDFAAVKNKDGIDLTWKASTDVDDVITDYEVSKDDGLTWVSAGTDLAHSFTSLDVGTTYELKVKAKDERGLYGDPASLTFNLVNTRPTAPTNFVATKNIRDIVLTWTASTDSDGTIVDYEVSRDGGAWISAGTDLTHTFASLTIGTTYQFRVRAEDNKGAFSDNTSITFTLANTRPTAPTSFVATKSGSDITLTWSESSDPDGTVLDYEVSRDGGAWISAGTDLTHTFAGLTVDTTYEFRVRAEDNNGAFSDNTTLTYTSANEKPTVPRGFAARKNGLDVVLTWNASTDSDGSISRYEASGDNGVNWVNVRVVGGVPDLTYTFTSLTIGTTYQFKVKARDNLGLYSDDASLSFTLTNAKPTAPTGFAATKSGKDINLAWVASTDVDGTIADYEVSKDDGVTWVSSGADLAHTFSGLIVGTTYDFKVKAKDNNGLYSDPTDLNFTLTNANPAAPTALAFAKTSATTGDLTWTASTDSDGTIVDYEVSMDGGTTWSVAGGTAPLTYAFTGLAIGNHL